MFPYTTFFFYTVPLLPSFIMPREAATGRGRLGKRKTPVRNARNYHLCLSRLKNFVEILGVQVFALMQKMLLSEHL